MKHSPSKEKRVKKIRHRISELGAMRLTVYKSAKHIYAQLFSQDGTKVLASASSIDKKFKESSESGCKVDVAKKVGALLAERAKALGIERVAFDRSGFKFHGRIKALAESVRENGVQC